MDNNQQGDGSYITHNIKSTDFVISVGDYSYYFLGVMASANAFQATCINKHEHRYGHATKVLNRITGLWEKDNE